MNHNYNMSIQRNGPCMYPLQSIFLALIFQDMNRRKTALYCFNGALLRRAMAFLLRLFLVCLDHVAIYHNPDRVPIEQKITSFPNSHKCHVWVQLTIHNMWVWALRRLAGRNLYLWHYLYPIIEDMIIMTACQ